MGSAGTDGMTGLFQVSLGEVKVAGEDGMTRNDNRSVGGVI